MSTISLVTAGTAGIEVRQLGATLYNSVYIGDDIMIVNGAPTATASTPAPPPVLHRRWASEGGLFDGYADSFEQVRRLSRPVPSQPPEE